MYACVFLLLMYNLTWRTVNQEIAQWRSQASNLQNEHHKIATYFSNDILFWLLKSKKSKKTNSFPHFFKSSLTLRPAPQLWSGLNL